MKIATLPYPISILQQIWYW